MFLSSKKTWIGFLKYELKRSFTTSTADVLTFCSSLLTHYATERVISGKKEEVDNTAINVLDQAGESTTETINSGE